MKVATLTTPTVDEVIKLLQKLPKDAQFRMIDADTNWTIKIVHCQITSSAVYFLGSYGEMNMEKRDDPDLEYLSV